MKELIIGSRGSALALTQSGLMIDALQARHPNVVCRVQVIKTKGDTIQDTPLAKIGDKGLFVKEIEQALIDGEIDFAVHSAKDLPSDMPDPLMIAAFPEREDPADVLVSKVGMLQDLPKGAIIGTSSLRRRAQILHARPDIHVVDLRGNLDTRLRKLDEDHYDAIILAGAGLRRLGLGDRITQVLPFDICLPCAGQGALAIQCRKGDPVAELLRDLDDPATRACVEAERALLMRLGAGCQTPVAALACVTDGGAIHMQALVASLDGHTIVRRAMSGNMDSPEELGRRLAEELLDSPAAALLDEARRADGLMGAAG